MEFPKEYKAPKLEDLSTKAGVAWGGCTLGDGASVGVCEYNGMSTVICTSVGDGASGACSNGY